MNEHKNSNAMGRNLTETRRNKTVTWNSGIKEMKRWIMQQFSNNRHASGELDDENPYNYRIFKIILLFSFTYFLPKK